MSVAAVTGQITTTLLELFPTPDAWSAGIAHAPGQQAYRDLRGTGIQRVVDQLTHHGCRALHHLTGGNLADQLVRQFTDRAAGKGGGKGIVHGGYSKFAGILG